MFVVTFFGFCHNVVNLWNWLSFWFLLCAVIAGVVEITCRRTQKQMFQCAKVSRCVLKCYAACALFVHFQTALSVAEYGLLQCEIRSFALPFAAFCIPADGHLFRRMACMYAVLAIIRMINHCFSYCIPLFLPFRFLFSDMENRHASFDKM